MCARHPRSDEPTGFRGREQMLIHSSRASAKATRNRLAFLAQRESKA